MEEVLEQLYHFRVHTDELNLNDLVEFIKANTNLQFIVKEYGKSNREHIHACFAFKTAKQTFIDRMKKKFPMIKGNKYYGCEKLKKGYDTNARYCYKGKANDYPDILYTVHTEEQWKAYYTAYWDEFKQKHSPVNTGCQNDSGEETVKAPKVRTKMFNERICEELWEDHPLIFHSIWFYTAYKNGVTLSLDIKPVNNLEFCQDYLADYLYRKLGNTAKNLDKLIFERLYRGMYAYILCKCPENLTKKNAVNLLNNFRHNL